MSVFQAISWGVKAGLAVAAFSAVVAVLYGLAVGGFLLLAVSL